MKRYFRFFGILFLGVIVLAANLLAGDLRLEGINYDAAKPEESLALINGKLLKAGETIEDYQIVKVDRMEVRVKNNNTSEESVLDMNKAAATQAVSNPAKASPLDNFFSALQKKAPAKPKAPAPAPRKPAAAAGGKTDESSAHTLGMMSAIQDMLPGSGPLGAYRDFINHVFRGEFAKAKTYVESGSGAEGALGVREAKYGPCVAENQGKRFSSAAYRLDSKKELKGGQMQLVVTQTASGDPPGTTSAFGSVTVIYKHQATLIKKGKDWKVRSFQYSQTGGGEVAGANSPAYWMCA